MPISIPRKLWLLVCLAGLAVAVWFAFTPVQVDFSGDPLMRLRQLDPELSPPAPTADCGSPISNRNVEPAGTRLTDVARAAACEHAARRRLAVGSASGLLLVVVGLSGLAAPRLPPLQLPRPSLAGPGGLLSEQSHVGGTRELTESGR